jgi:exopolysaccharide biosynthesis polyprenyl glycosylphosphotransferase
MRREVKKALIRYAVADYIAAALAWLLFLALRKNELKFSLDISIFNSFTAKDYILAFLVIPITWLLFHLFSGAYFNPYRKSRVSEILRTLIISAIGVGLISAYAVFNDLNIHPNYYVKAYLGYLLIQFIVSSIFRTIVLNGIKRDINKGRFGYNTLIIGGNQLAVKLYQDIRSNPVKLGYSFKGFVYADENGTNGLSSHLPKLGSITELESIIDKHQIEEVIIALDSSEHHRLEKILSALSHRKVVIKITPDSYDIISGSVRTSNVFGAVLIEIYPELMPDWQRVFKRAFDILASALVLILLSPLYLFSAIKVRMSSPGSIFYKQQRIGLYGEPFWIYKFRSMLENAEDAGPQLSSENDPRITKWGRLMRKWRIDELPQFVNILKGDMTLVGPRPERKYFIDIISQTHPHYRYLHQVKPGLTSWGMVKFGYAENTKEMIERMRYDLLYIKNCSMGLDIKIMLYTILVILQGRGK